MSKTHRYKCLPRDFLKIVAAISMLIDHIAAVFFADNEIVMLICRKMLGRIAFPIFMLLFLQGMLYTQNIKKHLLILDVCMIVSEPCFDYAMNGGVWFEPFSQNVIVTWVLSGILIWLIRVIHAFISDPLGKWAGYVGSLVAMGALAWWMKGDSGPIGVLLCGFGAIFLLEEALCPLWLVGLMMCVSCAVCFEQPGGLLAFPFIFFYDDKKRGSSSAISRYAFYVFYPLHLLILGLLRYAF